MKLRHLAFAAILLLLTGAVNATYIDEISVDNLNDIQYFDNDTAVALDGFNFTIPKGFGLIENESVDHADGNFTQSQRFYANGANEIIMISASAIVRDDLILSDYTPCDVDMDKHAVNGHDGIEWSMDNGTYFIYFDEGYLIEVGATDNSYFEDIIR